MPVTPAVEPDRTTLLPGRMRLSRGRLLLGVPVLLLGCFLLGTSPAAAHSELESTTPAADSSVTDPVTSVSLTFDDGVQPGFAQIAVLDPAGTDIVDGDPTIDGNTVVQPVTEATAGDHSVSYRIVSADGHTVQGTYSFTVVAGDPQPAAPTSSATASTTPTTPTAGSPSQAATSPAVEAAADEGSTGETVGIVVVLAIGVVATVAITMARRRHRRG